MILFLGDDREKNRVYIIHWGYLIVSRRDRDFGIQTFKFACYLLDFEFASYRNTTFCVVNQARNARSPVNLKIDFPLPLSSRNK